MRNRPGVLDGRVSKMGFLSRRRKWSRRLRTLNYGLRDILDQRLRLQEDFDDINTATQEPRSLSQSLKIFLGYPLRKFQDLITAVFRGSNQDTATHVRSPQEAVDVLFSENIFRPFGQLKLIGTPDFTFQVDNRLPPFTALKPEEESPAQKRQKTSGDQSNKTVTATANSLLIPVVAPKHHENATGAPFEKQKQPIAYNGSPWTSGKRDHTASEPPRHLLAPRRYNNKRSQPYLHKIHNHETATFEFAEKLISNNQFVRPRKGWAYPYGFSNHERLRLREDDVFNWIFSKPRRGIFFEGSSPPGRFRVVLSKDGVWLNIIEHLSEVSASCDFGLVV